MNDTMNGFSSSPGGDEESHGQQQQRTTAGGIGMESNELNETQKLQLAERANEIYRQQLKYMQDHLASLRSLIQDKENIIENLMLRYDLGIITQDSNRQGGNLSPDEIELEELRRKAEALAQRTILENFELREMVNELRDENFHLRNEIYELQDKINRQVLQINKLEKAQAAAAPLESHSMAAGTDIDATAGIYGMDEPDPAEADIYGDIEEEEDEDDDEDSDDPPPQSANTHSHSHSITGADWMNNEAAGDRGHGRRESRTMEHPANSEEAQQKRQERQAKHVRKESVKPPDLFNDGSSTDDDEEYMDDAARAKRAARQNKARKESIATPDLYGQEQGMSEEDDDEDDEPQAQQQANGTKRRGSQVYMDEDAIAKRQARQAKAHHRRESSIPTPNIFHDKYDPEKAERDKAKKDSPAAIEKRLKRKAKRAGQAAVKYVKSHRRKESLAEKLLLGSAFEEEFEEMKNADPEQRKELQAKARKEQRRKSRQLIKSQVGAKEHFSDDDVAEDKPQRAGLKARKKSSQRAKQQAAPDMDDIEFMPTAVGGSKKRPSVTIQPSAAADAQNSTKHRRDSSTPIVSLGFEDPDVLLHYEKLKVQDLQKELEQKLNELDEVKQQLASKAELERTVTETRQSAEQAQAQSEQTARQLDEAVESKAQLASKCAMEIMRLTMILNTLQRNPKIKAIVELLLDESAQKTNNKGGGMGLLG